jgi:L-lactate dehydrogenase complex protein LldG
MTGSREVMLDRIRAALADVPPSERPDDVAIDRSYLMKDPRSRTELVDQFIERVREYKATVSKVEPADLSRAIATACALRGVKLLVVPADLSSDWLRLSGEVSLLREPGLTNDQLEQSDGVLTACALGIAQTGTIVLDCGPGQGRRAITLLPDYHLCVIREDQIVGLVPEAVERLYSSAESPGRPITFISGPSATSDIELSRVEGVHGPRTLEVIVVMSPV